MLYVPPTGSTDPNASYVGKNTTAGTQGSKVPPGAVEFPQREIVAAIAASGQAPTNDFLGQAAMALARGVWCGVLTGSGDLAVATLGVMLPQLLQGMKLGAVATATNVSPNPVLRVMNLGSAGAHVDFPIRKEDGNTPNVGEIKVGRRYRYEADGAGNVTISGGGIGNPVVLQQSTTFYVNASTGSDGNDGLLSSTAFATIQRAADIVAKLNANGFTVSVNVADGTYPPFSVTARINGNLNFVGNAGNPANCIILSNNVACVGANFGAVLALNGFRLVNTATGSGAHGLVAQNGANITHQNMDFGPHQSSSSAHQYADGGVINNAGDYKVTGNAGYHVTCVGAGGKVVLTPSTPNTVTLAGTPGFNAFINALDQGYVKLNTNTTYVGSANAVRSLISGNAVVSASGAGQNFIPGSATVAPTTGGQLL